MKIRKSELKQLIKEVLQESKLKEGGPGSGRQKDSEKTFNPLHISNIGKIKNDPGSPRPKKQTAKEREAGWLRNLPPEQRKKEIQAKEEKEDKKDAAAVIRYYKLNHGDNWQEKMKSDSEAIKATSKRVDKERKEAKKQGREEKLKQ